MNSLADPRTSNPVLSALKVHRNHKIISIQENKGADSNFILTHLMKQIFYEENKVCLVSFHNSIEHYQHIGKKLGYDIGEHLKNNNLSIIDPLNDIVDSIGLEENYLQDDKEGIVKNLFLKIEKNIKEMLVRSSQQVYLIIDDLSHLGDIAVEISQIIQFLNYCISLPNDERIAIVINTHVATNVDKIMSNTLHYVADLHIEVSPLKYGRSRDVTGLLNIERDSKGYQYQYKAFDRGIKTFHPGEAIQHLYQ